MPERDATPDYRALFETSPGLYLVLAPDLTILAVSDAYLAATMTTRDGIVGRGLFDVFPDNPDDPDATGVGNLSASLDRVKATRAPDTMAVQKYDIRRPDGTFEVRYWSPRNVPALDATGQITHIHHCVEDVTELRRMTGLLDAVIEHIPDMVFLKEARNLTFVRMNRAGERLLGLSREELLGKNDFDFFPRDEAEFFQAKDRETLAQAGVLTVAEEPIATAQGLRWLHTQKVAIAPTYGDAGYLLGISSDITERKANETALRQAKDAVDTANRELEAFSYSVAHDLRAPLRSIDGFSQALLEDYDHKLDEEGRKYLRFVRESSQHMARLIDDLLRLSRISRSEVCREPVDLTALARDTIVRLERADPGRSVGVVIADGMRCEGDARLLGIVLDNLVGNAWKFTSRRLNAKIEVGTTETDGETAFFVRDNGAGFDMAYADKLFGVFQRLHGANEYAGTGVGLATVQRIVHRLGGRIRASAEVDQGATFTFTVRNSSVGGS
jgi:PAS domain S-box-containing protein